MNNLSLIEQEKRLKRQLRCCICNSVERGSYSFTTDAINNTLSFGCSYRFYITIEAPNGSINTVYEESTDTLLNFISFLNNKYKNFSITFSAVNTINTFYEVTVQIKSHLTILGVTLFQFCPCDITVNFDPTRPATNFVVYFWQGAVLVAQTTTGGGNTQVLTITNDGNYQICIEELVPTGAYGFEKDGAIQVPFLTGDNTANCGSDVVEGACNYYLYPDSR